MSHDSTQRRGVRREFNESSGFFPLPGGGSAKSICAARLSTRIAGDQQGCAASDGAAGIPPSHGHWGSGQDDRRSSRVCARRRGSSSGGGNWEQFSRKFLPSAEEDGSTAGVPSSLVAGTAEDGSPTRLASRGDFEAHAPACHETSCAGCARCSGAHRRAATIVEPCARLSSGNDPGGTGVCSHGPCFDEPKRSRLPVAVAGFCWNASRCHAAYANEGGRK